MTARARVARAALFAWFIPVELPRILHRFGPIPAVTSTSEQTGPWDVVGSSRRVHLADGSTAGETVTSCAAPGLFGYTVRDFTNPIGRFATEAQGRWVFDETQVDGATDITWTYTFFARSAPARILLFPVVHLAWRGYMRGALRRVVALAEAEA